MSIQKSFKATRRILEDSLYEFIYEKIENMELDSSFTLAHWFDQVGFMKFSDEYNVMISSYNIEIIRAVSRRLLYKGLSCNITFKHKKNFEYTTRVVNFKKYLGYLMLFMTTLTSAWVMGTGVPNFEWNSGNRVKYQEYSTADPSEFYQWMVQNYADDSIYSDSLNEDQPVVLMEPEN